MSGPLHPIKSDSTAIRQRHPCRRRRCSSFYRPTTAASRFPRVADLAANPRRSCPGTPHGSTPHRLSRCGSCCSCPGNPVGPNPSGQIACLRRRRLRAAAAAGCRPPCLLRRRPPTRPAVDPGRSELVRHLVRVPDVIQSPVCGHLSPPPPPRSGLGASCGGFQVPAARIITCVKRDDPV